ncbi:MAG: hypothetical protein HY238_16995 [Acidobacteria bacterium]|nr:hypothetical protein [Acidobacteriota bacterium]
MRFHRMALCCAAWLAGGVAVGQVPTNASLNGKYYFVQLLVTASGGQATNAQNLGGSITFNGTGGFTYTGKLGAGAGAPAASSGSGTYSVTSAGNVSLTNPIKSTLQIIGRLSGDANVLVGASTEASDNTNDILVAIKAPTGNVANTVLNGAYTGSSLQFPNGLSTGMKSVVVSLAAGGNGQFSTVAVVGHAADQGAGRNASQQASAATYTVNGDGTGTANFGSGATLFSGARDIFVSGDGSYLLGYSTANGGRDIFVATKNFSASAGNAAFDGRYWIAELTVDGTNFSSASGALRAFGNGRVLLSERLHLDARPMDFSGINSYTVNSDSSGALAPLPIQGVNNMAVGVSVTVSGTARPNTLVGAQIGAVNSPSAQYGIFFGVRTPTATGSGVFLDPAGVVNGASFAPMPSPMSLGAIASAFGSGLAAAQAQASTVPLPATLGGVSLTVNGTPAPLFFVSPTQINFQTPFGLTGNTVTIKVNNGGSQSNEVTVPLAPTGPAIFQYSDSVSPNRGIVLHADNSLVTPQSPAQAGETVIIYLTGLGALNPAVATGDGNPSGPLARATDPVIQILFGGEVATSVPYIGGAPGFVGLNQINVVIPLTTRSGPAVPVAISSSNAFTDVVDIPIR